MLQPLHAAHDDGKQDKPAQAKTDVDDIQHCDSSVPDALTLDPTPVKRPFVIKAKGVKAA